MDVYEKYTNHQLKIILKNRNVKGISRKTKSQLIELIKKSESKEIKSIKNLKFKELSKLLKDLVKNAGEYEFGGYIAVGKDKINKVEYKKGKEKHKFEHFKERWEDWKVHFHTHPKYEKGLQNMPSGKDVYSMLTLWKVDPERTSFIITPKNKAVFLKIKDKEKFFDKINNTSFFDLRGDLLNDIHNSIVLDVKTMFDVNKKISEKLKIKYEKKGLSKQESEIRRKKDFEKEFNKEQKKIAVKKWKKKLEDKYGITFGYVNLEEELKGEYNR